MRISLSTYSMDRRMEEGSLNQLTCIAKAKEMGFDSIEFVEIFPHDGSSREEYAKRLAEECRRLDIPVAAYMTGADFLQCKDLDEEIDRVKRQVDMAVLLGAPKMRHDVTQGYPDDYRGPRGFEDALPVLAKACREVTCYAAEHGVQTMVENHSWFCGNSDNMEKLVNAVNHPNFGLLCDMGNFLDCDEDPVLACARVAPYAIHVHAKDFHMKKGSETDPGPGYAYTRGGHRIRGAIVGHGDVPVRQCLGILKYAGFDGDITIEFEGLEEPELAISMGIDNLRRYLRELEAGE